MQLKKEERRKCKKCKKEFPTKTATRQCQMCQLFGKSTKKVSVTVRTTAKSKKKKEPNQRKLIKEVDALHSRLVRNIYAKNGQCECFTCGKLKPISEMQCGHYISRSCMWLRFDMRNTFCQCVSCNIFKNGNYVVFTEKIIQRFGMNRLKNLLKEKDVIKKWTIKELEDLKEYYKQELKKYGEI